MNLFQDKECAIVYEDSSSIKLVRIEIEKKLLQNRRGTFLMSDLVGVSTGEKIDNNKGTDSIRLFRPTQTLITDTVPHKTQILYHMDIAQVVQQLNVIPGSVVVESGTGSASLSYSISQAIGTQGKLHTFEFNEERYQNAQHVLQTQLQVDNVTCYHRDVYAEGFSCNVDGNLIETDYADAVFLDLPKPYDALPHAKKILKRNGRVCCFSPCIEQVQKNCILMKKLESLQRPFQLQEKEVFDKYKPIEIKVEGQDKPRKQIKKESYGSFGAIMMKGHTGYLTFGILY